jgi:hypothetical protein
MELDQKESDSKHIDDPLISFRARLTNPNILACGLRGIANGKRDQHVQVEILPEEGVRFLTTDPTKALQGCASVSERHFEEWQVLDESGDLSFRVNLAILLDCLTMLGVGSNAAAGLLLEYRPEAGSLSLQLMEAGAVTECLIRTLCDAADDEQALDFAGAFRAADSMNKAIVPSEQLKDAFAELAELQGASHVSLSMNPAAPYLRLSTEGETGICFIDFGSEFFSLFDAPASLTFSYRLNLLQRASKPLGEAEKTFMRVNSDGILSFQHLIRQGDGQKTYVDFYVLACEEGVLGDVEDD